MLIGASLVFYGWWDVRFIPLLLGQIGLSWLMSVLYEKSGRQWPLYLGVVINLASLATFKYLDFLIGIVQSVIGVDLPRANVVLPIGISFYTFELVSYLADRLRGHAPRYALILRPVHRALSAPDRRTDHAAQRDHPAIRL